MTQVLGSGALGRPRGIGWRGRWEGGLGWGIHVNPWLIHVNVWQKSLQYCKVISLQLIKNKWKKTTKGEGEIWRERKTKCFVMGTSTTLTGALHFEATIHLHKFYLI